MKKFNPNQIKPVNAGAAMLVYQSGFDKNRGCGSPVGLIHDGGAAVSDRMAGAA